MEQKKARQAMDQVEELESTIEQAMCLARLVSDQALELGTCCTDDRVQTIQTLADIVDGLLKKAIEQAEALELATM